MTHTRDKKKGLLIAMSILLVAALAIGGTLAYLTTVTEKKTNKFTLANPDGQDGEVEEEYDPDPDPTPGSDITKKVRFHNTSKGNTQFYEWVAVMVSFTDGSGTVDGNLEDAKTATVGKLLLDSTTVTATTRDQVADLFKVIEIQWNNGTAMVPFIKADGTCANPDWIRKNSGAIKAEEIFYYKKVLSNNEPANNPASYSSNLFDSVHFIDTATNEQLREVYTFKPFNGTVDRKDGDIKKEIIKVNELTTGSVRGGFDIVLSGAAIQAGVWGETTKSVSGKDVLDETKLLTDQTTASQTDIKAALDTLLPSVNP